MMGAPDVEEAVIDHVHGLSGGHPWVARTIAAAAWERHATPDRLVADDVERGLDQLYDDDTLGHFFKTNFWADMTGPEQDTLVQVAARSPAAIAPDVRASLRRQGLLVDGTIPIAAFAEWIVDTQRPPRSERVP
jgi:hypothetical protein